MAEVKNAFIKSKMNKDLDARLVPQGEYRNAINAQISRSEGADVGALENILGNNISHTFTPAGIKSIGYFSDETNNCIYVFLTDNTTGNYTPTGVGSNHCIYKIQFDSVGGSVSSKIIDGAYLNFSQQNNIYGVNLLEDVLFWTDNRNQPRKINVNKALGYYYNEDQISVATYNPYESIELWKDSSLGGSGTYETTMKDVVSIAYPDGGTCRTVAITALTSFPVTDVSFADGIYLDSTAFPPGLPVSYIDSTGSVISLSTSTTGYDPATGVLSVSNAITLASAETLVINPNPYYEKAYGGDPNFLTDKFIKFSYRFRFDDGEYSIMAPFTQSCFIPKQDGYFLNSKQGASATDGEGDQQQTFESTVVDFMENKVNRIGLRVPLPAAANAINSEYKINELDILYKESDGLAVQVVTSIPVADIATASGTSKIYEYDYQAQKPFKTLPESELIRVYDKVPVKALSQEIISNRIVYGNFQDKHTPPAFLNYNVNASEKSVFDLKTGSATQNGALVTGTKININNITGTIQTGSIITSSNPGAVPTNTAVVEVTGTPITQIQVSNTVTSVAGESFIFTPASGDENSTSVVEYPNASLKTNRNYQVGVVLSDKFGRQSTVILSNNKETVVANGQEYIGSTIYSPYISSGVEPQNWPGNSLKVLFNDAIETTVDNNTFYPGVYNGDATSVDYNPLGWYSYKIVVKQNEQDYYNIYTAGALKGNPIDNTKDLSNSYIVLLNDNINKVPRDLSEVGPTDRTFRSSVQLFGRVENTSPGSPGIPSYSNKGNRQYYPDQRTFTTNQIEDLFDTFEVQESLTTTAECFLYSFESNAVGDEVAYVACGEAPNVTIWTAGGANETTTVCAELDTPTINSGSPNITQQANPCSVNFPITSNTNPYFAFFRAESDPFVASITTSQIPSQQFGVIAQSNSPYYTVENLAILETEPVVSNIDIYWETSTSGLITDLNNLILDSNDGATGFGNFNSNFLESVGGTGSSLNILSSNFTLINNAGFDLDYTEYSGNNGEWNLEITSIIGPDGTEISTDATGSPFFELYDPTPGNNVNDSNNYNIRIKDAYLTSTSLTNFYSEATSQLTPNIFDFSFAWTLKKPTDTSATTGASVKPIELKNEFPIIYFNNTVEGSSVPLTLDYSTTGIFRTITAKNGAYSGAPIANINTGQQILWTLKVENAAGDDLTSQNYFTLASTSTIAETTATLSWNGGPIVPYTLTVEAIDGNDNNSNDDKKDTVVYTIGNGTTTTALNYCYNYQDNQDAETCTVCFIHVSANPAKPESVGYYRFYDGFQNLPKNSDGNYVLDYTSAFKNEYPSNSTYDCGQGGTGSGPVLIPGADPSLPASYTIEPYNGLMFSTSISIVDDYLEGTSQNSFCSTFCVDGSIINGTNNPFCNNPYSSSDNDWPITIPQAELDNLVII
tara:strand:- start:407 stop:4672 length:4266 start_codon:yes stop_codon:yes gene_type:complete